MADPLAEQMVVATGPTRGLGHPPELPRQKEVSWTSLMMAFADPPNDTPSFYVFQEANS
jgi:hypothetical protein